MSRSFTRGKKPIGSRSSEEKKDDAAPPARPVPLAIGGHRAPPSSNGAPGPAPISQMQTWKSARPTGAAGGRPSLLGRGRSNAAAQEQQESETEEAKYNNVDEPQPDTAPSPRPIGAYAYVSDEQFESEAEEAKYDNYSPEVPEHAPRPTGAYAYYGEEQAESEAEEAKYVTDDDLPQHAPRPTGAHAYVSDEQLESETEEIKYNSDEDAPQHAPRPTGFYAYVSEEQGQEQESEEAKYNNVDEVGPVNEAVQEEVEEEVEERVAQARPRHPERDIAVGPQLVAAQEKKDKAPEDLPAVRKHRTWLVAKMRAAFDDEDGQKRDTLKPAVQELAGFVATYYQLVIAMREVDPSDEPAWRAVVSRTGAQNASRRATTYADALAAITATYDTLLEKARREDLPIQEDGTLGNLDDRVVNYDHGAEQERTTVLIGGRRLWRNDQARTPVDTRGSVTHQTGLGAEIFVVGTDHEIHMASHKIGKFHHSSLLGGRPVSIAGEMKVTDGKIDWISNKSGHYVPSLLQLQQFLHILGKDVDLDFEVRPVGDNSFPPGTTAAQVVAGVDEDGDEDEEQGYDHRKTQAVLGLWVQQLGRHAVEEVIRDNGWTLSRMDGEYMVSDGTGLVDNETVRKALKAAYPDKRALLVTQK